MEPTAMARALERHAVERHARGENGNLIVCDMFGHRVVEVNPPPDVWFASARTDERQADRRSQRPGDGREGRLYITDPQFTPDARRASRQAGVLLAPDGTARVVIGPGDYAMPNGVETLTRRQDAVREQHLAAAGRELRVGLRRGRGRVAVEQAQFAMLNLTPRCSARATPPTASIPAPTAPRSTPRPYYVATKSGVQIFLPDGT
jgi:hypothetical protein